MLTPQTVLVCQMISTTEFLTKKYALATFKGQKQSKCPMGENNQMYMYTFPPYEYHKGSVVNRHLNTSKMWYNLNTRCFTKSESIKVMVIGLINACHSLLLVYCHFHVNFNGFKRLNLYWAKLNKLLSSVFKYFHFRKFSYNQAPS